MHIFIFILYIINVLFFIFSNIFYVMSKNILLLCISVIINLIISFFFIHNLDKYFKNSVKIHNITNNALVSHNMYCFASLLLVAISMSIKSITDKEYLMLLIPICIIITFFMMIVAYFFHTEETTGTVIVVEKENNYYVVDLEVKKYGILKYYTKEKLKEEKQYKVIMNKDIMTIKKIIGE